MNIHHFDDLKTQTFSFGYLQFQKKCSADKISKRFFVISLMLNRKTFIIISALVALSLVTFLLISFGLIMPHAREIRAMQPPGNKAAVDTHKKKDFLFGTTTTTTSITKNDDPSPSTTTTTAPAAKSNKKLKKGGVNRKHLLDIDSPARASASCPLPNLHPEKFQPIMHWGERKKFPSCQPLRGNFSRMERKSPTSVSVFVDVRRCPKHSIRVMEFGEMTNKDFTRMSSVYDAEQRQNQLRDKYKNIHTFAHLVKPVMDDTESFSHPEQEFILTKPYAVVECGKETAVHISAPHSVNDDAEKAHQHHNPHSNDKQNKKNKRSTKKKMRHHNNNNDGDETSSQEPTFKNILHFMWDSTSIYAFRRGAKRVKKFLENLNNDPSSPSHVFTFKHYHSVSCCSPGNQVPMYSGNMNGEGDFFVNSEPFSDSSDWLWNIARDELGYKTFWSLDNCPDKSARDYHAYPTVDSRVVAPICLAGVLLSHKERTCLGGKTVDEHVLDGLTDFWKSNKDERKFAAIQMITPHEETEKQLIEVDDLVGKWFEDETIFTKQELSESLIILWSDHGINFGKYASTHDGEIEKMFPFCHIIAPKKLLPKTVAENLRAFQDRLVTPYDIYATVRALMYLPENPPPKIEKDPNNPPLPRPQDSHIMASFQREIVPLDLTLMSDTFSSSNNNNNDDHKTFDFSDQDRSCLDANIPVEFCSCLPWLPFGSQTAKSPSADFTPHQAKFFDYLVGEVLIKEHRKLLKDFLDEGRCEPVDFDSIVSIQVQIWPVDYKPPSKESAKKVWMQPNRDFVKVTYKTKSSENGEEGVFVGVVSIAPGLFKSHSHSAVAASTTEKFDREIAVSDKQIHASILEVVRLDRMDAMKRKCGIVQKVPEQLCICAGKTG